MRPPLEPHQTRDDQQQQPGCSGAHSPVRSPFTYHQVLPEMHLPFLLLFSPDPGAQVRMNLNPELMAHGHYWCEQGLLLLI